MKTEPSSTPNALSEERVKELREAYFAKVRNVPRPTIAELEKILNSTDDVRVQIQPNGEVRAVVGVDSATVIALCDFYLALRREPGVMDELRLKLQSERDENFTLNLTCTQLGDERDALAADARRYRWLRSADSGIDAIAHRTPISNTGATCVTLLEGEGLDTAIDAALTKAGFPTK